MKATFRACGDTEQVDYPLLTKEEIYKEFIEWLLEKADASVDFENEEEEKGGDEKCGDEHTEFDFENEVIPGMTDGSMGRTWSQDWE